MFQDRIIKRIPGTILSQSPREKQGYVDLNSRSKVELIELIERQNKLISNKGFISKLSDKGAKIISFRDQLESLLSEKENIDEACGLLSDLNLNAKQNVTEEIEWTGKYSGKQNQKETLDSDDDSDDEPDPIKILASQSVIGQNKKQHRIIKPEESLIKSEDLKEIESFKITKVTNKEESKESSFLSPKRKLVSSNGPAVLLPDMDEKDGYIQNLCEKLEKPRKQQRESYKPYRTTRSGVHSPSHPTKPHGPHWEVTAATPPTPIFGDTKVVCLLESLNLQKEQAAKLKDIQVKHASERLITQLGIKIGSGLPDPALLSQYQQRGDTYDSSSSGEEDEEAHSQAEEEEEHEKDGAVVYNIID